MGWITTFSQWGGTGGGYRKEPALTWEDVGDPTSGHFLQKPLSGLEYARRLDIFAHNLAQAQRLQEEDLGTAEFGETPFSDLTGTRPSWPRGGGWVGCLADGQSKSPPLKSSLGDCPKSQRIRQELNGLCPSLAHRPGVEDAS